MMNHCSNHDDNYGNDNGDDDDDDDDKYIFHMLIFKKSLGKQLFDPAQSGDVEAVERLVVQGANIEYIGSVREVMIICLFIFCS